MNTHPTAKRRVRKALVFLYVAIFIIVAATAYEQHTLSAFHAKANAREEAISGLLRIERTLSLFKDVEDGPRGFALTGDETYLAPYHVAVDALPGQIAEIKAGFAERPPADLAWAEFDQQIARRLSIAARVIDERRRSGATILDNKPLLDSGIRTMDNIRASFARLITEQSRVVDTINAELGDIRWHSLILNWLATGLTIVLMALSMHMFLSERRIRRQLAADLRLAHDTLEERVATRTRQLADARNRIAGFAGELDRSVEAERWRLSREVHDQLGPIFTAIRMALMGLPPGALPPEQEAMLNQSLDSGVATTRRIAAELRPPLLDDLGLEAAVQHFLAGLFQNSGVQTTAVLANQDYLTGQQVMSIFRLIQEASTNVIRHAKAANFAIHGAYTGEAYEITMADDGKGMDVSQIRPGLRIPMAKETEREIREDTAA